MNHHSSGQEISFHSQEEMDPELKKICAHNFYESQDVKYVSQFIYDSEICAEQTIDQILTNVVDELEAKALSSKVTPHIHNSMKSLMEIVMNAHFMETDETPFTQDIDEEAMPCIIDNWGRGKVGTRKLMDSTKFSRILRPETNESTVSSYSIVNTDKRNATRAKDKAKKFLEEGDAPNPINVGENKELNDSDDDMRQLKDREQKRKIQDEIEAKLKRERDAKKKGIRKEGELDNKTFTTDFEGNIVIVQALKTEKFPPSAQLCNSYIVQSEPPKFESNRSKKGIDVLKSKMKKIPDSEKEFVGKVNMVSIPSPPMFELFTPEKNVSLMESGRVKHGDYDFGNSVTLNGGSFKTADGSPIRITKSEYMNLTRGGNLNRTLQQDRSSTSVLQAQVMKSSANVNDVNFDKQTLLNRVQKTRGKEIKSVNLNALDALVKSLEEEDRVNISTTFDSKRLSPKTIDTAASFKRSPIDTFNQDILQSKDWGKSFGLGMTASLPHLPNHKGARIKKVLGPIPKQPRDRALHLASSPSHSSLYHSLK